MTAYTSTRRCLTFIDEMMPMAPETIARLPDLGDRILFGSDFPNIPYNQAVEAQHSVLDPLGDGWNRADPARQRVHRLFEPAASAAIDCGQPSPGVHSGDLLEDEARLRVRHALNGGQVVEDEVAQVVAGGSRDVDEEVVGTRHVESRDDTRDRSDALGTSPSTSSCWPANRSAMIASMG